MKKLFKCVFLYCALLLPPAAVAQLSFSVSSSSGQFSITCANSVITLSASSSHSAPVSYSWSGVQGVSVTAAISVTAAGMYTVYASAGSVSASQTIQVAQHTAAPGLTVTLSSGSISCVAPRVYFSAGSNLSNPAYLWGGPFVGEPLPPSSTYTANVAGTYTATVIDPQNGCATVSLITVGDNVLYPHFNAQGLFTISCPNGTTELGPVMNDTAGISFKWQGPAHANIQDSLSPSLIVGAPGVYTVTGTNRSNGCSTKTELHVWACAGIESMWSDAGISLYPNPASDKLVVFFKGALTEAEITIVDLFGSRKYFQDRAVLPATLSLEALPAGVYFVQIRNHDVIRTLKFVKE